MEMTVLFFLPMFAVVVVVNDRPLRHMYTLSPEKSLTCLWKLLMRAYSLWSIRTREKRQM